MNLRAQHISTRPETHFHSIHTGVPRHIRQRFLNDPVRCCFNIRVKPSSEAIVLKDHSHIGVGRIALEVQQQRVNEAEIVQDRGAQI